MFKGILKKIDHLKQLMNPTPFSTFLIFHVTLINVKNLQKLKKISYLILSVFLHHFHYCYITAVIMTGIWKGIVKDP